MLLLPAFGLMFVGFASGVVNGILTYRAVADAAGTRAYIRAQLPALRGVGLGADDPPADRDRLDDERAATAANALRWVLPAAGLLAVLTFLGGFSMALRWNYRLAQLGCVAAAVNLPHLCCVPGAPVGLWGLLLLGSDEGRAHFTG